MITYHNIFQLYKRHLLVMILLTISSLSLTSCADSLYNKKYFIHPEYGNASISDRHYIEDRGACEAKSFATPREYTSLPRKTIFGINDREPRLIKVDNMYDLGTHALNGGDTKEQPASTLLMKISKEVALCMNKKGWSVIAPNASSSTP